MRGKLTYPSIFGFWFPLALTGLVMTGTGLINSAGAGRIAADPKVSLAAWGVAVSVALILESPTMSILDASLALVRDYPGYLMMRRYSLTMCVGLLGLGFLIFWTPFSTFLLRNLMNIPPDVTELAVPAMQALMFSPGLVTFRRMHQAVLVTHGRTKVVGIAAFARVPAVLLAFAVGAVFGMTNGALMASLAYLSALTAEATVNYLAAHDIVRHQLSRTPLPEHEQLTPYSIWCFHSPLAMVSVFPMLLRPLDSLALAAMPMATISLAAWPVTSRLTNFFTLTQGSQQTAIALIKDEKSRLVVGRFIIGVGIISATLLGLCTFTPLADYLLSGAFGVPEDVKESARLGLYLMTLVPMTASWQSLFRGQLIGKRRPKTVRSGMWIYQSVYLGTLGIGLLWRGLPGVLVIAIATLAAPAADSAFLYWRSRQVMRAFPEPAAPPAPQGAAS